MSQEMTRLFIVMGVSGCGKSSIGKALANEFSGIYLEGDDLHPEANIKLMSEGTPLTDTNRWPWLENVAKTMASETGVVFASCSALKKTYRLFLKEKAGEPIFFIHLSGSKQVIAKRMSGRAGHFMPVELLNSQFEALEAPDPSEPSVTVDISKSPKAVLRNAVSLLGQSETSLAILSEPNAPEHT